jgi:hypothetical protein
LLAREGLSVMVCLARSAVAAPPWANIPSDRAIPSARCPTWSRCCRSPSSGRCGWSGRGVTDGPGPTSSGRSCGTAFGTGLRRRLPTGGREEPPAAPVDIPLALPVDHEMRGRNTRAAVLRGRPPWPEREDRVTRDHATDGTNDVTRRCRCGPEAFEPTWPDDRTGQAGGVHRVRSSRDLTGCLQRVD